MTLLLEIPETTERALQAKAAREGVALEHYAARVLQREVEFQTNGGQADAPALRECLARMSEAHGHSTGETAAQLTALFNANLRTLKTRAWTRDELYERRP